MCEGSNFTVVLEFTPEKYPQQLFKPHSLLKCLQCGLVFLHPHPSKEEVNAFYAPTYYTQNWQTEYAKTTLYRSNREKIFYFLRRNPLQLVVKLIRRIFTERSRFLKHNSRFLDIGCGNGVFLLNLAREAKKLGYAMELFGQDIVLPQHVAFQEHHITLRCGDFHEIKFPDEYFDFLTAHHSIEHLSDASAVFKEIYRIAKKGAQIAIEVPNIDSFSFKVFKEYWSGIAMVGHLFYFSPATLRKYAQQAGFLVKKLRHVEDSETFLFSLLRKMGMKEEKVERLARNPLLNLLFMPFVQLLNILRLGDTIEIILVKS